MMRWGFLLLLGMLAVSLLATSTVHAREFSGVATLECSGVVGDGKQDSEPAPAEKSAPAQHATCHAPAASIPSVGVEPSLISDRQRDPLARIIEAVPLAVIDRDIRPPIA